MSAEPSYSRKIFTSAAVIAICSFLAKGFSAVKDLIVAAVLGTGIPVDAFLLAALIPLLSVSVLAAPYGSALVPVVTRFLVAGDRASAFRVVERATLLALCPLLILAVTGFFLAPQIAGWLVPEAGPLTELTSRLLRILSSLTVIAGLCQLLTMVLAAFELFVLPALSQMFSPLMMALALLLLPAEYMDLSLALGAVAGNLLQLILLGVLYLRERRIRSGAGSPPFSLGSLIPLWAPLFISALLMSLTDIIDQIMAAQLGEGQVAVFSYGSKVSALLISVLAGSLTSAAFPYLSQMIERGESELLQRTLRSYTCWILAGSGVGVLLLCAVSLPVVQILFERGQFTAQDSGKVAFVQQMALLQVPFYLLNGLYMRVIMARGIAVYLSLITVISVLLNIILNVLFARWIGVAGIALSTSCVYLWSTLALGALIARRNKSPVL